MPEDTSKEALDAQKDEALLDKFIKKNKRFILSCAYNATGHFVSDSDDEYSIALIAFNEAVKSYDYSKGDFNAFAKLVIKRRLIDYSKKENKFNQEISIDGYTMDGDLDDDSQDLSVGIELRQKEAEISSQTYDNRPEGNPIKDEIEAISEILATYEFSFFDLADCSPKAGKTKASCARAIIYMLDSPELIKKMRDNKSLPLKEITQNAMVPRKILERHRKYIISAIEILNGDYPLLAEYMSYIKEERRHK
ncbi:MAG: RNA polymerase subunit sigma [Lachnospiraceae bacterium]|nr:RNA polymerase subunit sigma [Lachnospiraceae bacterium]